MKMYKSNTLFIYVDVYDCYRVMFKGGDKYSLLVTYNNLYDKYTWEQVYNNHKFLLLSVC